MPMEFRRFDLEITDLHVSKKKKRKRTKTESVVPLLGLTGLMRTSHKIDRRFKHTA